MVEQCKQCPRKCGADRSSLAGYCAVSEQPLVASVTLHFGEEPVLVGSTGVCNLFFAHCNLQCVYCQNHQISDNSRFRADWLTDYDRIVDRIARCLDEGATHLGFVSPSHQVNQMLEIIERLYARGLSPRIIYNTNSYDSVEQLQRLEDVVDVYLPDFKYYADELARRYSGVADYFDVASRALREMYRQKGASLLLDRNGTVESGLIVRHLVLPGCTDDSCSILRFLADELSSRIHLSLMAQYYPVEHLQLPDELNRYLSPAEYDRVVDLAEELGFGGWIQELDSSRTYRPDFSRNTPFG